MLHESILKQFIYKLKKFKNDIYINIYKKIYKLRQKMDF